MDDSAFPFETGFPDLAGTPLTLAALASLCLILAVFLAAHRFRPRRPKNRGYLILDGSNILYWEDDKPKIGPLSAAIHALCGQGYKIGVVFDANAGYLVSGRYMHNDRFAKMLGIPKKQILVVPKGEPADGFILDTARELGARVVTNDRYRDWAEEYPEVATPGYLIKGGYEDGGIWLDLPEFAAMRASA